MSDSERTGGEVRLERKVRPVTVLRVVAQTNMVDIDSETDQISFGAIYNMYKTGPGFGLQVNDESKRTAIEKMCFRIADAVRDYHNETA